MTSSLPIPGLLSDSDVLFLNKSAIVFCRRANGDSKARIYCLVECRCRDPFYTCWCLHMAMQSISASASDRQHRWAQRLLTALRVFHVVACDVIVGRARSIAFDRTCDTDRIASQLQQPAREQNVILSHCRLAASVDEGHMLSIVDRYLHACSNNRFYKSSAEFLF